jgi:hypothetical protein
MAFHTNSQSEVQLLRQQQKIREQLQALLAPVALPAAAGRPCASSAPQPRVGDLEGAAAAGSTDAAQDAATSPVAEAASGGSEGHSVRDKAAALLAVVSGGQQGLSPGDLAWLTKAGVDAGANSRLTKELAAAGCLSVQDATCAEALLAQLSKLIFLQQQQSRSLTMMVSLPVAHEWGMLLSHVSFRTSNVACRICHVACLVGCELVGSLPHRVGFGCCISSSGDGLQCCSTQWQLVIDALP